MTEPERTDGQRRGWCWRRQQRPGRDTDAMNLWESGLPPVQWPPRDKTIKIETFSLTSSSFPRSSRQSVRRPSCRLFLTFHRTGFTGWSNAAVKAAGRHRSQRGCRSFWGHGGSLRENFTWQQLLYSILIWLHTSHYSILARCRDTGCWWRQWRG